MTPGGRIPFMAFFQRVSLALLAVAVPLATGCSSSSERRFVMEGGDRGRSSREIRIEVVNDNYHDMGIFVMEGGTNYRIGDVSGKSSRSFTLGLDQISPRQGLRLLADPVGSREEYLSDAVNVGPGAIVVFNIAPALRQSYVILR